MASTLRAQRASTTPSVTSAATMATTVHARSPAVAPRRASLKGMSQF
jgi:hypothetical protein